MTSRGASDRKRHAAAAGRGGIRVAHLEEGAGEILDEIELGAAEQIERGLIDFYLGGAILYLIAVVPWDGFGATTVGVVLIAAPVTAVLLRLRSTRRGAPQRQR